MVFTALSDKTEILAAFGALRSGLTAGVKPLKRNVGWRGGGDTFDVFYLQKHGIWCVLEPAQAEGRFWCSFGVEDPRQYDNLTIVCEINSPLAGVNRRCAGVFVKHPTTGETLLAHSGKIGGGRKGIGKAAFLTKTHSESVTAAYADGTESQVLAIGALRSSKLRMEVAHFVHEVARVKPLLANAPAAKGPGDSFSPEFGGKKKSYVVGEVQAIATHGPVVSALYAQLVSHGQKPFSDQQRDLFLGSGKAPTLLFEIKTAVTPYTIYTGVGQLMVNTAGGAAARRVLVLPSRPGKTVAARLKQLGIALVTYRWKGDTPVFTGLLDAL